MGERGVVVIPAYRETANIADVIAGVRAQLPDTLIVVVDTEPSALVVRTTCET